MEREQAEKEAREKDIQLQETELEASRKQSAKVNYISTQENITKINKLFLLFKHGSFFPVSEE